MTCASGEGVEVWKSVVSALCTATNNPQNGERISIPFLFFSLYYYRYTCIMLTCT